jgi:hypothetical protein
MHFSYMEVANFLHMHNSPFGCFVASIEVAAGCHCLKEFCSNFRPNLKTLERKIGKSGMEASRRQCSISFSFSVIKFI